MGSFQQTFKCFPTEEKISMNPNKKKTHPSILDILFEERDNTSISLFSKASS